MLHPPASASQALGLQVFATTLNLCLILKSPKLSNQNTSSFHSQANSIASVIFIFLIDFRLNWVRFWISHCLPLCGEVPSFLQYINVPMPSVGTMYFYLSVPSAGIHWDPTWTIALPSTSTDLGDGMHLLYSSHLCYRTCVQARVRLATCRALRSSLSLSLSLSLTLNFQVLFSGQGPWHSKATQVSPLFFPSLLLSLPPSYT
jgi:hypothetical protein